MSVNLQCLFPTSLFSALKRSLVRTYMCVKRHGSMLIMALCFKCYKMGLALDVVSMPLGLSPVMLWILPF